MKWGFPSQCSITVQQVFIRISQCWTYTDFEQLIFTSRYLRFHPICEGHTDEEKLYIILYELDITNTQPWGTARNVPQYKGYSKTNKINQREMPFSEENVSGMILNSLSNVRRILRCGPEIKPSEGSSQWNTWLHIIEFKNRREQILW